MVAAPQETTQTLTFAHSPDPDDAYMFYGFACGAVKIPGYDVHHHLEDIQTLNERALNGEFEITAVSAHAYAHLAGTYWALSCGASVGRKYGPVLVRSALRAQGSEIKKVAIPGKWTTAALVYDLWMAEEGRSSEKVIVPFDQILGAVKSGQVDAGLIIHEGQLTYERDGFKKIWDAGEWWDKKTGLPLPLGLDVVRSDLGLPLARQISRGLRDSILYANAHSEKAMAYALEFGRGLDTVLGKRFVGMYVNQDTLDQGKEVQDGLKKLYDLAFRSRLIPNNPPLTFI
jgi:1,4-dihydroxy-6-naphthoate synthase